MLLKIMMTRGLHSLIGRRSRVRCGVFALLFISLTGSVLAADWEPLPRLPEPNGGFVCGVANGKVVVVGGTKWVGEQKIWLRAVHGFDPAAKQWAKLRDLSQPLAYGTALQRGAAFAWLGGSDGQQPLKAFEVSEGSKTSVQLPQLPVSMVLAAGGDVAGKYLLVGGTDDAANLAGLQRSVHEVAFVGSNWQVNKMADYPGKPFAVAASAVVGDKLFVFGGMNYDAVTQEPVNSVAAYVFSPARNTWRELKALAVANRGLAALVLDEQHIYLAGGYASDFTAAAVIYDVKSDSYRQAKSLPYAALVGLVKLEGFAYCLGGEDRKQARTDKVFRIPLAELLK